MSREVTERIVRKLKESILPQILTLEAKDPLYFENDPEVLLKHLKNKLIDLNKEQVTRKAFEQALSHTWKYALMTLDSKGIITSWNEDATKLYGYTQDEILGKHFSVFYPENWIENYEYCLEQARQSGLYVCTGLQKGKSETIFGAYSLLIPFQQNINNISGFILITSDVQKRPHAHEQLFICDALIQKTNKSIIITDARLEEPGPQIVFVNPGFTKLTGYTSAEVLGRNPRFLQGPKTDRKVLDRFKECMKNDVPFDGETVNYKKNGTEYYFRWQVYPIKDKYGKVTNYASIHTDITEQHHMKQALQESEQRYRLLADNTSDLVSLHKADGVIDYVSPSCERILGYKPSEVVGKSVYNLIHPDDIDRTKAEIRDNALNGKTINLSTYRIRRKEGEYIWLQTYTQPVKDIDGNVTQMVAASRDVTGSILADQQLKSALKEKQMLLMEIHHRVKNNLQIASSLLTLQSAKVDDNITREMFNDTQKRLQSMAFIHEQLYRTGDIEEVQFDEYLKTLADHLFESAGNTHIVYKIDAESIKINLLAAMPLGLIVNELITNALKYAFKDRDHGKVHLTLVTVDDQKIAITCSDDGVGLPPNFVEKKDKSLGMQLVYGLVEQLNGTIEISSNGGTTFYMEVRVK